MTGDRAANAPGVSASRRSRLTVSVCHAGQDEET
jgi:hypothetical protein